MDAASQGSLFDQPEQFLQMGIRLVRAGRAAEGLALADKAMAERGDDPLIRTLVRRIRHQRVPPYHYAMLRDHPRNAAYRKAIEAVAPGRVVLDIGTGSGLLAMLAARAGAAHVHACEENGTLAHAARQIIERNGLSDRITVHAVNSSKLNRVRDLGGGADLVVSEIFGHDLLGEAVLPSLSHARAELCVPGALFLPERAAVRVALADMPAPYEPLGDVEGFDLSLFNPHMKRSELIRDAIPLFEERSPSADLLRFDFAQELRLEGRDDAVLTSAGGRVTGIAQWLYVELGGGVTYENPPGTNPEGHWRVAYFPMAQARDTEAGEIVTVHGWHGSDSVAIWVDE